MTAAEGYRLKVKEVRDLSVVIDGFRADALRLLARSYGRLVAADAVRRIDLHILGKPDRTSGDSPLADANLAVQRAYAADPRPDDLDLDCELALYLVGDAVLARFISGNDEYRKAWESRREVHRWGWSEGAERPKGISEQNWKVREICWRNALSKPGLGSGLRFVLIEGGLPQIGWGGTRRYLPSMDDRVRAVVPTVLASKGRSAADMTAEAMAEFRRRLAMSLPRELTKDHLTSYPTAQSSRAKAQPRERAERKDDDTPVKSAQIDHADVVQSSDGRVFVAVPYVGLDTEDRVFVQVADSHVAITQNATQWGYVADVPRRATDLLRECKSVILVEVERKDGRRLLRAKHVAIVKDISLVENVSRTLGRWRTKGLAQDRDDGEIKRWDSEQSTTSE